MRAGLWLGLVTGLVYFAGTIYWTGGVMSRYGGLSLPLATAVAGLLVTYLALFPAAFGLITLRLMRQFGAPAFLLAPFVWAATEYGRLALFGGFPWVLLGYSQVPILPIAQMASVTGVFGVSWLLVASAATLAWLIVGRGRSRPVAFLALMAAVVAIALWGWSRIGGERLLTAGRPLRVGIVQGNVAQDEKWQPTLSTDIFERYLQLTREVIGKGATLVLWPESSTPFYFGAPGPETTRLRELASATHTAMLIGSDQWERGAPGTPRRIYNAAFLIAPDGTTGGVYRKVHLVPFGEYVPLQQVLFFAAPLVEAVSDFSPGTEVNTLPVGPSRISTAICYEVVYPALIREGVLSGSELLTTITNDAWFGRSSAPWQHFEMASMRAIEEGRYLVRSANTGISGVVDPYGRVLLASELFVTGAWVADVRLIHERTVYASMGDVIVWVSIAVTALALAASIRSGGRRAAV